MNGANINIPLLALAVLGFLFGGWFAVEEWFVGPSFATNDSLIWTLPLVSYIFLALASTGVSVLLAGGELLGWEAVTRNKEVLLKAALALLIGGFAALATEMGSPFNVFWLLLSPNFKSPIWWMGTLYSIELALLGVKFWGLVSGRHFGFERLLTGLTLTVALAASLVLGSVFGTVIGREAYSGVDASVLTLLCAMASGLVVAQVLMKAEDRPVILLPGRLVLGLLALLLFVKWVYLARSTVLAEVDWVNPGMPLLLLVALWLYRGHEALAALVALPTVLWVELSFVVQGQLHVLGPKTTWMGAMQSYMPNLAEAGILVFGCSVAYLCFALLSVGLEKFAPQS